MGSFLQDLRSGLRSLFQSPGFTAVCVLTLGLGIGANTAIFSAVDAVLFRPLPVREPAQLYRIYGTGQARLDTWSSSYPIYTAYRDEADLFTGMSAFSDTSMHLSAGGGKPERITGALVSGSFFDVLGVGAALGRVLGPEDEVAPGTHPVAVLGNGLWHSRFGADPHVVGRTVQINGKPFTVVGVAPRGFVGCSLDSFPQLWLPMSMAQQVLPEFSDTDVLGDEGFSWLDIVARLRPEALPQAAQVQLDTIAARRLAGQAASRDNPGARIVPADSAAIDIEGYQKTASLSWLLAGVVVLVLLIACADAAGLMLLRAEARRRETAIRLALGAPRRRIVRQLLLESLLLASMSAGLGLLLAAWGGDLLSSLAGPELPIPLEAASPVGDLRVLLFTALAAAGTGLLFGMAPALRASAVDPLSALRGEAPGLLRRRFTLRDGLVLGQVVLAAVLLSGAGLLLRTLYAASHVELGFDPDRAILATVDLSRQGYTQETGSSFYEELLEELRSRPEVQSAALVRSAPVQGSGMIVSMVPEGHQKPVDGRLYADYNVVSSGYFEALGVPLLSGRDFSEQDVGGAPAVGIISQAMAARYWPGQPAVGKRIADVGPGDQGLEVIGVARDFKVRGVREDAADVLYVPLAQQYLPRMSLLVRTRGPAEAGLGLPAAALARLAPDLPVFGLRTLREQLGLALAQEKAIAGLLAGFGLLALVLAVAGLYSVVSSSTQARTREFGIRLALGAKRGDIRGLVLWRGLVLAAAGLVLGLGAALGLGRLLEGFLFQVGPTDAASHAGAGLVLILAAGAASAIPARRATRVDPAITLRHE